MHDEELERLLGDDEALTFVTLEDDVQGIVMIAFADENAAPACEPAEAALHRSAGPGPPIDRGRERSS